MPDSPDFDPEDFDAEWQALMTTLASIPNVVVEPGDEVMVGGRVVDLSLGTVQRGPLVVHLVDAASRSAQAVCDALKSQGHRVLVLDAGSSDNQARVIAALEA